MTDQGLLRGRDGDAPRVVTLSFDQAEMILTPAHGKTEWVAMSALRIRRELGGQLLLGRRGKRSWSLQLSGSTARDVRALLPPLQSRFTRWRRWAFRNPKLAAIAIAAPFFLVDLVPGLWFVPLTTPALAERLDAGVITAIRRRPCDWPQGQRALDALVRRLDPLADRPPTMIAAQGYSFFVSAIPGTRIVVFHPALTEVDAEVLAALVAHEMAHIRNGEVLAAIGRGEGHDYLWRLVSGPDENEFARAEYTAAQERAADEEAIRMLRAARISVLPAAAFFARIDDATTAGRYFAQDYAALHPGSPSRALRWSRASAGSVPVAFDEDQLDGLFNMCAFSQISKIRPAI